MNDKNINRKNGDSSVQIKNREIAAIKVIAELTNKLWLKNQKDPADQRVRTIKAILLKDLFRNIAI